jgi:hypothetical protein
MLALCIDCIERNAPKMKDFCKAAFSTHQIQLRRFFKPKKDLFSMRNLPKFKRR